MKKDKSNKKVQETEEKTSSTWNVFYSMRNGKLDFILETFLIVSSSWLMLFLSAKIDLSGVGGILIV